MLGKLSWSAVPFDQPIPLLAGAVVIVVILAVLVYIAAKGWIPYLWREWITSVDHKRIGAMYVFLAMVMLLRGFIDALMMRSQQALAFQSNGYLPPEHYNQIFSAHGTLMIFFVAMPILIGLMNVVVPLQLGVRDVAFPTLNNVSFWLTATGALLVNVSLVVGEFSHTGWLPFPPLSELTYSPGVGVDYYLWAIQIAGVGTLLTGVNFVTTILKLHAPGMTYLRMPMFCWTALATNLLIVASFPVLTATLAMLLLDRYLGYHFFTMGAGGDVNTVFGIASMIIAVPTGVKIYNWLFTMYGGRIVYATPMMWAVGFMVTFVIGGLTGVLVAMPPADFVVHNSLFLVAHFHNVIIGGAIFGAFAGYTYWFPKVFGFQLDERLGKWAFWCWFVGFYLAFVPLYVLGLMGMPRRLQHYDVAAWRPWTWVAGVGALVILAGIVFQIVQLAVSIRKREALRDVTGDPWNGRSLEWSTASPPPAFNFAALPRVEGEEPYWEIKQRAREQQVLRPEPHYVDVEMPLNSPTGFVSAFFASFMGFALIWHIWWLALLTFVGAYVTFVIFAWRDRVEYHIPADEVARIDRENRASRRAALAQLREFAK